MLGRKFATTVSAATLLVGAVLVVDGGREAGAAPAAPNQNCALIVPADPLSAAGLATPYQLVATDPAAGPCNEANPNQSAFVEAAILAEDGTLTTYDPLVVDQGTQPAVTPVPAQVNRGATVGIWFGFNGANLTLKAADGTDGLTRGHCVNGLRHGSIFGQFAYCNAREFFRAANRRIGDHRLVVPATGTAKDGLPCPTVRDFVVVDQDQSDNVVTHYLATANGQTAQLDAANTAQLANAADLANGSDNLLLSRFIDPALGCSPWMVPNQSADRQPTPALATDELSAAANQQAPIALVPLTDPMTLNNGATSVLKTDLYRQGVNQGLVRGRDRDEDGDGADAVETDDAATVPGTGGGSRITADGRTHTGDDGDGATYCTNLFTTANGVQRVFNDQQIFAAAPSVDPAAATNLFTFLAMRAQQTFGNLNCQALIGKPNPVTLTTDANGAVTAATFTPDGAATTTPTTSETTPPETTQPATTPDTTVPADSGTEIPTPTTSSTPTLPTTVLPTTAPPSSATAVPSPTTVAPTVTTAPPTRTRFPKPGRHGRGDVPTTSFGRHW
ncbi:hypothetical protein ACFXHA_11900 [Nocardia sp. NPDC059240]|uniref:hypothetical protein n=1 Tax=Nocardia sp. NPDC059240 TaxID=3346786 RepID=UPI00367AE0B7